MLAVRVLKLIRCIFMLPAGMAGMWVNQVDGTRQLPRQRWLQQQPLQLRILRSKTPQRADAEQGWRVLKHHPWMGSGFGRTEMRVRVLGGEYRFTVESQSNDRWEMQQLIAEAPLIAQWAQRQYGGSPIEVIVRR